MGAPAPKLQQIPHRVACVADYEPLARERLTDAAWAYLAGGAADELTLQRQLRRLSAPAAAQPGVCATCRRRYPADPVRHRRFEYPILLGPVAHQELVHPDGELATVLAAAASRPCCGQHAGERFAGRYRRAGASAALVSALCPARPRFTLELVQRAEAAGYRAIVLTVDAPVSGLRNREQRAGFALPPGFEAANLRGMPATAAAAQTTAALLGGPCSPPHRPGMTSLAARADPPAAAAQGYHDAARRQPRAGRGRRWHRRLQPWRAHARYACPPTHRCPARRSRPPSADRVPILLDGGIRRGTTCSRRSRWGPARC